ncbi:glycosyltransferase family 4 protein [Leptolyngbya boryana CZ1]|uniref:Glycosyltransferase family 4 protein n=1 Tax=Leptolyngbya boryana CZ1 TaxID=3060204 RepID=A0AA96WP98_LEPBY|nr:glycosyltransferase family 4 protein [Leptolyngbya boryana]WNZ43382.1 glycosyltransferase family 4 protein [Leptolyngbya boryana CZ1]
MKKLAIITSHPIQYYAPWFRYLAALSDLSIRVFYLWDFGITQKADHGFQQAIQWDIPLLTGYDHEFVPNISSSPGTHHFWGLYNPTLNSRVRAYAPDVVLLMNYNYVSLYQFLASWHDTPILFRGDSHRLVPERGLKAWLRQQWIRQVFRRFDGVLYVGQANYDYFRAHGVPSDRLFFSPHAIDNERFSSEHATAHEQAQQWKQELGIPSHHRVILFAGKLIPKKRPNDLLEAFLEAKLPNTSLLLVGSGALEPELRSRAASHDHVFFAPFQNQSLMPRTYAIADVFVLPSYGGGETWGLAVNEAMCLAKPIIVSNHVGCASDLVEQGQNGWIFPAGDTGALKRCLQEALSDRNLLIQQGEQSLHKIQHYSYSQVTTGLRQALSQLGILSKPEDEHKLYIQQSYS